MTYTCIKPHPRLTIGKQYTEIMPHNNVLNACIWNDDGGVEYVDIRFFKVERV